MESPNKVVEILRPPTIAKHRFRKIHVFGKRGIIMIKKKKLLLGILGATVALTLLAGCGGSPAGGGHPKPEIDETPLSEFSVAYDAELQGAVIKKYTGSSLKVRIPDKVEGEPVVKIGKEAFEKADIMYLYIPNTVKVVGSGAFKNCKGIPSIDLPESVIEIGEGAFYHCEGLTSIKIPSGVTELSEDTFYGCASLASIEFSPNMTTLSGFRGCTALTSIDIPDSVTRIDNKAFRGCNGLTEVVIPGNVKEIGVGAFDGCENLASVNIPEGITTIDAFNNCPNLAEIQLPNSVTELGGFSESGLVEVVIPAGVQKIKQGAFWRCENLTSVKIPEGVTAIDAFADCPNLTEIQLPNSLTELDGFSGSGLRNLVIPSTVKEIGSYAFSECKHLTSVDIPESVTKIGEGAFSGCDGLTEVTIPGSVQTIRAGVFSKCKNLTRVNILEGVTDIESDGLGNSSAFNDCPSLKEVYLPDGISISRKAFQNCESLNEESVGRIQKAQRPLVVWNWG